MAYVILLFISIVLFILLIIIQAFKRYIDNLSDKITVYYGLYLEYSRKYRDCMISRDCYADEVRRLQEKVDKFTFGDRHTPDSVNKSELLDAVKFAMKCSHPDNGGDSKKFMKFRELYNKLKRGD